jgi:uncharacterized membrane protein
MTLCSIAIAAGVLGMVALARRFVFRRRMFGGSCGGARHRWGRGGFGGPFGGPGGTFWLRALFARLDTTPGQEREIRSAIEDFQTTAREAKGGLRGTRDDLAKAISGEVFDEIALGEASVRADGVTSTVKEAFAQALKRIHGVLDSKQRERLAELLTKGRGALRGGWGGGGGPYREVF